MGAGPTLISAPHPHPTNNVAGLIVCCLEQIPLANRRVLEPARELEPLFARPRRHPIDRRSAAEGLAGQDKRPGVYAARMKPPHSNRPGGSGHGPSNRTPGRGFGGSQQRPPGGPPRGEQPQGRTGEPGRNFSGGQQRPPGGSQRGQPPQAPGANLAIRSNGHRVVLRAASATTGRVMMALGRTARARMVRGRKGSAATDSHTRHARAKTTMAAEMSRLAAMIARSTVPPTRRAGRSGCTACTRSRPRSPTPRAGCAAWC